MEHFKNNVQVKNNVFLVSDTSDDFEAAYIETRKKENRIHSDAQVKRLPKVESTHNHYSEWKIREKSAVRVLSYLKNNCVKPVERILDIGCGNGWFSDLLAKSLKAEIVAIDVNLTELEQAARVFSRKNLYFSYLDIFNCSENIGSYSQIIFNSSFQYFEIPESIIDLCLDLLTEKGEIHIIDSPFYQSEKIPSAKQRSVEYYKEINCFNMNQFYHHHSWDCLNNYNINELYHPAEKSSERKANDSPFPWIRISK